MKANNGEITEGLASILPIETNEVFYNPVQVVNRDLSVLLISVYSKCVSQAASPLEVLEGLAASGLRSIRYAKELKFGDFNLTANDIEAVAVERIRKNMAHNGLSSDSIRVENADAIALMQSNKARYSVIDLDPYGSCSIFLDSAISSVKKPNGLLCITSTDGGVLCGNQPDLAFMRYGGFALKKNFAHEMGLRVLLHAVSSAAARQKRGVKVLASFSIDFYFRVFVQVIDSGEEALKAMEKCGILFSCINCEYHINQPFCRIDGHNRKPARTTIPTSVCPECDSALALGGPMYTGALCDDKFVDACLDIIEDEQSMFPGITSWTKLKGLLFGIKSELACATPLFYTIPGLTRSVRVSPPKLQSFYYWLNQLGYKVCGSHRTPNAIKTNAPSSVVFDLLRIYCSNINITTQSSGTGEDGIRCKILNKAITMKIPEEMKIDFTVKFDSDTEKSKSKIPIYIPNPTPFWGPKPRAVTDSNKRHKPLENE